MVVVVLGGGVRVCVCGGGGGVVVGRWVRGGGGVCRWVWVWVGGGSSFSFSRAVTEATGNEAPHRSWIFLVSFALVSADVSVRSFLQAARQVLLVTRQGCFH